MTAIKIEHTAPLKVVLIDTGGIRNVYLKNCARFLELSMEVCKLQPVQKPEKAARFRVSCVAHPDEIISDPNIDCILNLTIIAAYAELSLWPL